MTTRISLSNSAFETKVDVASFQVLAEAHNDLTALYIEDRKDLHAVVHQIPMALLLGVIIATGMVIRDAQAHDWWGTGLDVGYLACWVALFVGWAKRSVAFTDRPALLLAQKAQTPTPNQEQTP